jgi:YfiH family protein
MFLTSDRLAESSDIRHGFFTRRGGVSTGIFAELNCGGRDTAEPAAIVDENRRRVAARMRVRPEMLLSVYQVHGPRVVTVESPWIFEERPKADAMVTRARGVGLGILTADCAPVLFADVKAGVVGAAHSGWKGAFGGVLQATVAAMETLGARREHIIAVVGPTIAQASYEVDAAFHARFLERDPRHEAFFTPVNASGKRRFDLPGFVEFELRALELGSVECLGRDTYQEEESFYSFRRSTHRGEVDYGRQLSTITLSE